MDAYNSKYLLPAVIDTKAHAISAALRAMPFSGEVMRATLPEGLTITQALFSARLYGVLNPVHLVYLFVNDELIRREEWRTRVLLKGDIVAVNLVPGFAGGQGGGGEVKAVRAVAMLAIVALSIWSGGVLGPELAPLMPFGSAGAWGAAVTMAVSTAGMLAMNALIPPPGFHNSNDASNPSYAITGMQNRADPYGPVPRLYGKFRLYPRFAAMPYTEIGPEAGDQYLRCLFCIGKGEYVLSDFKIGDTALSSYTGIDYRIYYTGTTPDLTYDLFPNDSYELGLAVELSYTSYPDNWQTRTTQTNTDEIQVQISFPEGLYEIGSTGNRLMGTVNLEVQYSPAGQSQWKTADSLRELIFTTAPTNSGIVVGATVLGLTSGAQGTIQFVAAQNVMLPTGEYTEGGAPIYATYTVYPRIRVITTSGIFQVETVRIAGSIDVAVGSISEIGYYSYVEKIRQPFMRCFVIKVPRGQYDVRVRRSSVNSNGTDKFGSTYWTALRSISYIPPVKLADCTLVALRIKATGQLAGTLDQFNCVVESVLNSYDGVDWHKIKTRNPAWIYTDILCGTSNKRPLATSRLNAAALYAWSQNCTAAGRYFDGVFDFRTTVWEALKQVCAVGRATPGMVDNIFTVIEDKTQTTPVQHFGQRNSWGFQGSRVFVDIPHAYKIRFFNETKAYAQDECICYADKPGGGQYSEADATLFETLEFFGVCNYDQCWKLGRYMLACLLLRPEKYVFNTDMENLVCTRGDLVKLAHDSMLIGLGQGRVKTCNANTCTFDDVFPMQGGDSYAVRIRKSDGSSLYAPVNTVAGENYSVTFSSAIGSPYPQAGDLIFFGKATLETIDVLINRIDPGPNLTAKLTAIPYASAVLTADGGEIPPWTSDITLPPIINRAPPKPKIISHSITYSQTSLRDDGTYDIQMIVGFEVTQSGIETAGLLSVIDGFMAEYSEEDGQWVQLLPLGKDARSFQFPVIDGYTYDVRVRSFSPIFTYSDWEVLNNISIDLAISPPPDVSGLQIKGGGTVFTGRNIEIEWTAVPGGGTLGPLVNDYKVEVRSADGLTIYRTEVVTQPRYSYTFEKNLQDGGPKASLQFRVWAHNKYDKYSVNYASLIVSNPAPANVQGLGARSYMGGVEFYWTHEKIATGIAAERKTRDDVLRKTRDDVQRMIRETISSEEDWEYYLYRIKIGTSNWGEWTVTLTSGFSYTLSETEKNLYGEDATIYFEIKSVDFFKQESGSSAIDLPAGVLSVVITEIDDFAVTASKLFTKIPVLEGLVLTSNAPSSGRITWSACTVYYNGVAYPITTGNTSYRYVYWKDLSNTFTSSNNHPADSLSDWKPGEDFIIAVNISGVAQEAWNGIANQVIGSAYIMNASINDAHVSTLSGTKISASTSIAIGSVTFGNNGIQFEYNGGSPRFYAGSGGNDYLKYSNASGVEINSGGSSGAVRLAGGTISIKSATFGNDGIQLDYNAANPRFYCGDGANNYLKFDGSSLFISTSGVDGIVIKSGSNIRLEAGGDLIMQGHASNPAQIRFLDPNSVESCVFESLQSTYAWIRPPVDTQGYFSIGYYGWRFHSLEIFSYEHSILHAYHDGSNYARVGSYSDETTANSYVYLANRNLGTTRTLVFSNNNFYPDGNNAYQCGTGSYAWQNVYAYVYNDLADYYILDDRNDLELLKQIKGSGKIDEITGLELVDDNTLPELILSKNDKKEIIRNENDNNKPYISHKALLSLLMGACRQLDARIEKIEKLQQGGKIK